jgi:hypothetical protein
MFSLKFTLEAVDQFNKLKNNNALQRRYKSVLKALAYLENNPKHPSLNTHKYSSIKGQNNEEIFEAYAENNTPTAYRIFWHYGEGKNIITIVAILPHP